MERKGKRTQKRKKGARDPSLGLKKVKWKNLRKEAVMLSAK